jgi:hypothetical protein
MVAELWLDRPPEAKHVHHINGNKADNRADNLEWLTPKRHAARHGTSWGCYAPMPESGKEKLRQFRLGTTQTPESNARRSATMRETWQRWKEAGYQPHHGHLHTPETKAKMSASHARNTACEIDGITYRSFSEAARDRGERPLTLRKRCLSPSFPNYVRL